METGQYIRELFVENEYVIIPGFGALTAKYKPARFEESLGLLLPPGNEIVFNDKLKNNDGILAGRIAAGEKTTVAEAQKIIENFCENIRYLLGSGKPFEIEGLGTLAYDKEQNIVFEAGDENLLIDSYGLEPAVLKSPEKKEIPAKKFPPMRKIKSLKIPFKWQWLIPVPLVIIVVLIFIFKKPTSTIQENGRQVLAADTLQEKQANAVRDSVVSDSVKIVRQDSAKTAIQVPVGEKYILIGGSFKSQENADKYFKRVSAMGYQPEHLGKKGDFYIVAVGVYPSAQEAEKARLEYLSKEPDSGAWVILKK